FSTDDSFLLHRNRNQVRFLFAQGSIISGKQGLGIGHNPEYWNNQDTQDKPPQEGKQQDVNAGGKM
ncbi:hypothetical protein, partial [Schleiferilactobacillus harbinensis]